PIGPAGSGRAMPDEQANKKNQLFLTLPEQWPPALSPGVCAMRKALHGCLQGFQASVLPQQVT
uniref:Uncharacterized protein n=1 Tax=Salvator merianae TaxID=96440 RepID=A0A8D0E0H6_SALMN